jgi:hypothetical protein
MWNSIKERIFPFIIAFSALSVSASAAFYSVTGLSMLFAGASFAVMIMAASLEIAKLVIASLLYQYRKTLPKLLKIYLTIAAAVLILITSAGIYGYLSAAYQKTADQTSIVESKIAALESKKKLFEETRDNILKEKQSIANLQGSLSQASTTQYTDKNGNLVIRSNNAAIRNIESASKSNEKLSSKIDVVNDSIFSIESKILEVKTTSTAESELGPLKYLSKLTGIAMDRIINWYILVIIFVFDPLAIALVIAANFAFAKLKQKDQKIGLYDEKDLEEMREWEEASLTDLQDPEDLEWDEYGNPSPVIKEDEEYKKQTGVPVMVDPKTGKFFYEEPDTKPKENVYGEDPSKPVGLDLDGDGVVEEEEVKEVFEQADTNNDGIIDKKEAKIANLSTEEVNKLNQFNESLERLQSITDNINTTEHFKKMMVLDEVANLRNLLTQQFQSRKDDDTITYF